MIETSFALSRLAPLDDRRLRASVAAAIFEGRTAVDIGLRDAQPEDIFVPILANPDTSRRQVVLAGCRDVFIRFFTALSELTAGNVSPEPDLAESAEHFSALLSASQPRELHSQVRSLLEAAINTSVDSTVREPLVTLAVSFATLDPRPEYWQDLLNGSIIPGHAFQALLRIDPRHPRLEGYLANLWQRALRNEISLRLPFFVDNWAKRQIAPSQAICRVLRATLYAAPDLQKPLRTDCTRYGFSASWAEMIQAPASVSYTRIGGKRSMPPRFEPWIEKLSGVSEASGLFGPFGNLLQLPTIELSSELHAKPPATERMQIIQVRSMAPMTTFHSLLIRHSKSEETDEIVKTSFERMASNLLSQIELAGSHSSQKKVRA